jgi:hypothetical protein
VRKRTEQTKALGSNFSSLRDGHDALWRDPKQDPTAVDDYATAAVYQTKEQPTRT